MRRFWLPAIIFLAFVLRIVNLGNTPSGFTPDEASFGYDAYSLLKTGKDQWGKPWPIVLESFGDFKSPLYAYLTMPSVAVFGLNKFAVRFPNAIIGTLAVLVVYFLTKKLFKEKKLAIVAALLLAISPWHLPLSRGAFEANLTTFFLPLGILFFLKKKFFVLSALVFGLNLFTYHSAKIVTPLVVIFLIILYKKLNPMFLLIFSAFVGVTIYSFILGAGRRAGDINIYKGSLLEAAEVRIAKINSGANPLLARAVYNKYTITLKRFAVNYTSYFSPRFLFLKGPAEATYGMLPGKGVLYPIESIFLAAFFYYLVKSRNKQYWFILFWILVAPLSASLTQGIGYAANRVAVMMPAIQIASALGAMQLFKNIKKQKIIIAVVGLALLFAVGSFIKNYFNSKYINSKAMLYGNLEVMDYLSQNYPKEKIIVSTQLSEPQIYWAFATKTDPETYQKATEGWNYKEANLPFLDQLPLYQLGNVSFKRIDWKQDSKVADVIVGRPEEFPKDVTQTEVIYYPDGTSAIYAKAF